MIADDRWTPFETAVAIIAAPVWVPIYLGYVSCHRLAEAWSRRKPKEPTTEILPPAPPWLPTRDIERAVYAALILAGEPVNNRRLAELMDCSPSQASRRVAQLEGQLRKVRKGRFVEISLH